MEITRAVITAAGPDQRDLPLQRLVDLDGVNKTCLQIVLEETVDAGVEEICLIVAPGDAEAYRAAAGPEAARLRFVEQKSPRGYGHALLLAADFVDGRPFLHLVGDHLYLARGRQRCARQLVRLAGNENCTVSAVQSTRESNLPYFGAIGGRRVPHRDDLYEVESVLEKPTPTEAEHHLLVPGLRNGHYLCLFGMHVLSATILEILTRHHQKLPEGVNLQLSPALSELATFERYLALQIKGSRYNIGMKYGLLFAQLALGLAGRDRDEILSNMVEMLANRESIPTGETEAPAP